MPMCLVPYPRNCTGCRFCEIICSLSHERVVSLEKARLRVVRKDIATDIPFVCAQCQNEENKCCAEVCPEDAIFFDGKALVVDEVRCTGCGLCERACAYGVIRVSGVARKCDLCGGDPLCVKFCPFGAIKYEEIKKENFRKILAMMEVSF